MKFLLMSALLLSLGGFSIAQEIEVHKLFKCDFEKIMSSEEGEKLRYLEGEVVKDEHHHVIIEAYENDRSIFLKVNCKGRGCPRVGHYVKLLLDEKSKSACLEMKKE